MTTKIGINGFGRIGRMVFRAAVQNFSDVEIVGINDLLEPEYLAYMLQYDSVHGRFKGTVAVEGNTLVVNGQKIRLTQERDPANLKWNEVGADVVIEATGLFLDKDSAGKHLAAGAKKAGLVSAMGADANSKVFYSRVKGELEDALTRLPWMGLIIARPSMLEGNRAALGQPTRRAEEWASALGKLFGFLIPANYKPIEAAAVASALLSAVPSAKGLQVLLSGVMQQR